MMKRVILFIVVLFGIAQSVCAQSYVHSPEAEYGMASIIHSPEAEYGMASIIVIIGCVIFVVFLVKFFKRKSRNDDRSETFNSQINTPVNTPPIVQPNNRLFTLTELKCAEAGKYSWDETGCVFEVNTDGSVTVVGHFDPAELLIDPKQQLYDNLVENGFFEMLPKLWGVFDPEYDEFGNKKFWISYDNVISYLPISLGTIDDIRTAELSAYNAKEAISHLVSIILNCSKDTIILLLPANEQEFIFSLGIQSCLKRYVKGQIRVRVSSPAVMGAFGAAIKSKSINTAKISFAFGEGMDYRCCNILVDSGVYGVENITSSSIILPLPLNDALLYIAKGCMAQTLILSHYIKDALLLDIFPYTVSLLLKENNRVVKTYELIKEPANIPTRSTQKDVIIGSNQTLSFIMGSNEIIPDVIRECGCNNGTYEISVDFDADMSTKLVLSQCGNIYSINIGELIG